MTDEETLDVNDLVEETAEETTEETQEFKPEFDLGAETKELDVDAIKAQAVQEYQAGLIAQQQAQAQVQQRQVQDDDSAEIAEIARLRYTGDQEDFIEAERRSIALAEKRYERKMESKYGAQLQSAGQTMAINDAKSKVTGLPAHVAPYLDSVVRDLGVEGPIPDHLIQPIRELAHGRAAMAGTKANPPRTVRVTGAEPTGATQRGQDTPLEGATEFERAFGKEALANAIKRHLN